MFFFFLNTCQRSTEYLSRAKGKNTARAKRAQEIFTRRVKRPFTNTLCGVTFVPENRKITCPFRNLCSFWLLQEFQIFLLLLLLGIGCSMSGVFSTCWILTSPVPAGIEAPLWDCPISPFWCVPHVPPAGLFPPGFRSWQR